MGTRLDSTCFPLEPVSNTKNIHCFVLLKQVYNCIIVLITVTIPPAKIPFNAMCFSWAALSFVHSGEEVCNGLGHTLRPIRSMADFLCSEEETVRGL